MNPLCSACAFRIWKIKSCFRMPGRAGDVQVLADLGELLDAHVFQIVDVQAGTRRCAAARTVAARRHPLVPDRRRRRLVGCGAPGRLVLVGMVKDLCVAANVHGLKVTKGRRTRAAACFRSVLVREYRTR